MLLECVAAHWGRAQSAKFTQPRAPDSLYSVRKHGRCVAEEEYELHECVCAGVKGVEVGFALQESQ